ncbi:MAG: YHS domain-containing protein [Syntrophobacterales bacterium]
MIRLAILVFLLIVLYKLLSGLVKGSETTEKQEVPAGENTAELVQDPQCGAYILPAQGEVAQMGGKTYHFCSESCRDQFLLEHAEKTDK